MTMARLIADPRMAVACASASSRAINEISFGAWVAQAEPSAAVVYHRGFLVVDTDNLLSKLPPEARGALRQLANAAMRAAEQGLVHLVQARLATDHFAYIAIARPKPRRPGVALSMRLLEAA
jgi:hypothetical protein